MTLLISFLCNITVNEDGPLRGGGGGSYPMGMGSRTDFSIVVLCDSIASEMLCGGFMTRCQAYKLLKHPVMHFNVPVLSCIERAS